MPTKADLTQEIYLLLGVIHVNGFVMTTDMAQRIFDRWPDVMGPRPESVEAILNNYNTILQQTPAETLTKTTRAPKIQKAFKNDKHDSPFSLARSKTSLSISRVPKYKPAVQTESSAGPSPSARPASNKDIEVIDLSGDIEDQKDSLSKVYPPRKRLCPLDSTSHPAVKKEEHEADFDEKVSDEFVACLLNETPSKKPKME
ncbi:hypothetical protein KCU64_g11790, partial [Aureobasidium melanogenum]